MKKFYEVKVMNRFDNDRVTEVKYFTTHAKAIAYATKVNDEYEGYRAAKEYGYMVYHVDMAWGIVEHTMDDEEA